MAQNEEAARTSDLPPDSDEEGEIHWSLLFCHHFFMYMNCDARFVTNIPCSMQVSVLLYAASCLYMFLYYDAFVQTFVRLYMSNDYLIKSN